ncbi:T9SS type A sorting domain-containing protein, partial [Bacteroidota bacterium]
NRVLAHTRTYWLDTLLNNHKDVLEYYDNGLMKAETWHNWDQFDDHWFIGLKYQYLYDSLERLIEKNDYSNAVEYTDSIDWDKNIILTYDKNGRQNSCFFYIVSNNIIDTIPSYLREFEYDNNNNLSFVVHSRFENKVKVYKDRVALTYREITNVNNNNMFDGTKLFQNYPNPIENTANVDYTINGNVQAPVKLSLFNSLGQEVLILNNGNVNPGINTATINTAKLSSGNYYLVLKCGTETSTLPVAVIK